MAGLHYCEDCWYYDEEEEKCVAKHTKKRPRDSACTDFSDKNEED